MVGVAGVLGLVVGSALNPVIGHLSDGGTPTGRAWVGRCVVCQAPPTGQVIVRLWGRCGSCPGRVVGWWFVPSATAVLFALAVLRFGATAQVGAYLYLAGVGVVLAMVDLNTRRLPDVVVLPSYIAVLGLLLLAAAGDGSGLLRALAGCGVLVVFPRAWAPTGWLGRFRC